MNAQKKAYKELKQEWRDAKRQEGISKEDLNKLKMAYKSCQYVKRRKIQKLWINIACACVYIPSAVVVSVQAVHRLGEK